MMFKELFVNSYVPYSQNSTYNEFYSTDEINTKPDILQSQFMSKLVVTYIKQKLHCKIVKEYIFDNTRVSLTMYCVNKKSCIDHFIKVMNFYIYVLNQIRHTPVINIIIYNTNLKKVFPAAPNLILNENNVNSGVTMFNDNTIVIYRKEELYKVLLHELIHLYQLDFHTYDVSYDKYLMSTCGIHVKTPHKNRNNPLALFESYTESLACYGHILTHALFHSHSIDESDIQQVINRETKYYMLQASKVFKYGKLYENAHVFSYYIAKAALYRSFDRFIGFVDANHIRLDTETKKYAYLDMLTNIVLDSLFWKALKTIRTRQIFLSSLKMSKLKWS